MISVQQAIEKIEQTVKATSRFKDIPLEDSLGMVLRASCQSRIDLPPFRQSAMDGYALCLHNELAYDLIGEVAAGSSDNPELKPGQAVRIFTGAPVPDSANSIVIQEIVTQEADRIYLEKPNAEGANIRPQGEQLHAGDQLLAAGHRLTPASLGLLAGSGLTQVRVADKPKITVVVTGDELKPAGSELAYGQIYESNGIMLQAALQQQGYNHVKVVKAKDDLEETTMTLDSALKTSDVVLVSGGISVGDYDFAQTALGSLGVEQVFYKVKQKPGKPLFFGCKEEKLVFALPGNPASALSCFYGYVLLALKLWEGENEVNQPMRKAVISKAFVKKGDRAQFLKARVEGDQLHLMDGQASSMLHSFALANALAFIDADVAAVEAGDQVPYLKID